MGILDKIMGVGKKKDNIPDLDFGKPSDTGDIGGMGDNTAGLGGTGDLGTMSPHELPPTSGEPAAPTDDTIHGLGHEDVKMERTELRQEHQPFSRPTVSDPTAPMMNQGVGAKDLELISSKLDALKAQMEMINNKLSTMDMRMDEVKRRGGW